MLFCNDALLKTRFLSMLVGESVTPVLYLDFDLLYTGYHGRNGSKTTVFKPESDQLDKTMGKVADRLSSEPHTLILDSLTGLSNIIRGSDPTILLNVYLMLIASTMTENSRVIIASLGRKRDGTWTTVPVNRHIIVRPIRRFHLGSGKTGILITGIDGVDILTGTQISDL